jgi:outer membrane protein OmpA-like peptidoglycan-associated protein
LSGQSFIQRKDSLDKLQAQFIAFLQKRAADSLLAVAIPNEFRVHYNFNKAELDKNDKIVLDSLVNVLKLNDKLQVSIGSFTDCKGNVTYNQKLSAKRSKVVVVYLKKKGVASSRFISSYYGKSYFVQACLTGKYSKSSQIVNRRTELLLTERKNTTWDVLHQSINEATHKILSSLQVPLVKPVKINNKPVVKEVKKTVTKPVPAPKVDTVKALPVVKEVKKTVTKPAPAPKVDTVKALPVVKEVKKPVVKVAPAPKVDEEAESISKAEILQALDSLAKLKSEQERIVNYLTKRINKKPILIYTSSDSVNVEIYDSGIHDKDSVSIIYNNRIVVDRKELNVKNPIKFGLRVSNNPSANQLIFVAENLGYDPPNTAVMIITDKNNKRQEIILNTDLTHNEVVKFIKIVKN